VEADLDTKTGARRHGDELAHCKFGSIGAYLNSAGKISDFIKYLDKIGMQGRFATTGPNVIDKLHRI
jgi:hypothetical protein